MRRKLSLWAAVLMLFACTLPLFGCGEREKAPPPVTKARLTVDSNPAPTLLLGESYKLQYTASEQVTIRSNGTFDEENCLFTADRAGTFEIVLTVGEGERQNSATVVITVLGEGEKSKLLSLLAEAEGYLESDWYGFDRLRQEMTAARAVVEDSSAPQSEVDAAAMALENALRALRPQPYADRKAVVEETLISYGGKTYYKNFYSNFEEVAAQLSALNSEEIALYSQYDQKVRNALETLHRMDNSNYLTNLERGTQMALRVYADYCSIRSPLFGGSVVFDVLNENGAHIKNTATGSETTDFWTLTSLLALMVRLDGATEESHKQEVDAVIEAMTYHLGTRNDNHAGENGEPRTFHVYAVHRDWFQNHADVYGKRGEESVFDDQIWAAQEFLNAYLLYGEKSYLDRAVELTEYIYEVGNDPYLGGIYWGQAYTSRHACSNAPFVKLAVMLSEATGEQKYLTWAKNIYQFAYHTLRDPADDLYCDLIQTVYENGVSVWEGGKSIANGGLDTKKYSYNSGSMISAGVALYNATGEQHYLDEAKRTASSCRAYFGDGSVLPGYNVYPGSDGQTTYSWFNLILFKGYLDLYRADSSTALYLDEVEAVHDYDFEHYFRDGYQPTTGLKGWTEGRNSYSYRVLMDHVTNADIWLLLSDYRKIKG